MISQVINRVSNMYEQYQNLRSFFTSVVNGEFNHLAQKNSGSKESEETVMEDDSEIEVNDNVREFKSNKPFDQNATKSPSSDFINSKMESMTHSQGVAGHSGSGYKGAGKAHHDKIIHNKPRHA